jgi:hypothetical protein
MINSIKIKNWKLQANNIIFDVNIMNISGNILQKILFSQLSSFSEVLKD